MATALGSYQQASAMSGTINRGISNEGQILMDALKAFIVPIVHACLSTNSKDPHKASPIATSSHGEDPVLSALKTYVGHLVEVEIDCRNHDGAIPEPAGDTAREDSLTGQVDLTVPILPSESDWQVAYKNAAPLLFKQSPTPYFVKKYADTFMEHGRNIISNRWPIRMLWFNKTGSFKLIGRGDVFSILQTKLYHDLTNNGATDLNILMESKENYTNQRLKYAILSHTWLQDLPGEITYKSWVEGSYVRNSAGYKKLENFCRVSAARGFEFGWMDTICINKDSSSELDESIRSMYRWYEGSGACITYLAETEKIDDIHRDRWFTRGWTLQELVAPRTILFYNRNWDRFTNRWNDRQDVGIVAQIERGSRITADELASFHTRKPHISRRMQWAADRRVTREEDTAYSLMGIFDVSMSTAYGEGAENAFARLIKKIITNPGQDTVAMDIVNCYDRRGKVMLHSAILPYRPAAFNQCYPAQELWQNFEPHIPMMVTQRGLHVSALLIRGIWYSQETIVDQRATWGETKPVPYRDWEITAHLLRHPFNKSTKERNFAGVLFAVLNHTVKNDQVDIPTTCLAIESKVWKGILSSLQIEIPANGSTVSAVLDNTPKRTFSLTDKTSGKPLTSIHLADLEKNGLYLRTLYM